ncbi:MAG: hypothetical protein JXA92_09145 [candidate division Zixibacteria bacterium]|nr:hypothetical protein [candidate division Zixibacteria bacterium]
MCKNKAAIRATASVEAPVGLLLAEELRQAAGFDSDFKADRGAFLLYPGRRGIQLEIKIDGVRMDLIDPDKEPNNSLITDLEDNSKIKLIDPARLLKKTAGAKTVTVSLIYSEN